MPSGYPLGHDPYGDRLWTRLVDLVEEYREPGKAPHVADRDGDSITWLMEGSDGTETHFTVRERPFFDLPFERTFGRPGVWGDLCALRVGLSTLVAFRADPAVPGRWAELDSRPGVPSMSISVTDDVGGWYDTISGWTSADGDFGLRFSPPSRETRVLKVLLEDRGVLIAEYTAELPTPLKL